MSENTQSYAIQDHVAIFNIAGPVKQKDDFFNLSYKINDFRAEIASNREIRVVIVTDAHDGTFSLREDLIGSKKLTSLADPISKIDQPVIAAITGDALGQGLELALSCDIRIASETSCFELPQIKKELMPMDGGTQRLSRLIGKGKALEMISSAGMISAEDALSWGLVNKVVTQEELLPAVMKLASRISANSPTAISAALRSVLSGYAVGKNGLQEEIEEFGKCFGSNDFKEGTSAFLDKRKPEFTGE